MEVDAVVVVGVVGVGGVVEVVQEGLAPARGVQQLAILVDAPIHVHLVALPVVGYNLGLRTQVIVQTSVASSLTNDIAFRSHLPTRVNSILGCYPTKCIIMILNWGSFTAMFKNTVTIAISAFFTLWALMVSSDR